MPGMQIPLCHHKRHPPLNHWWPCFTEQIKSPHKPQIAECCFMVPTIQLGERCQLSFEAQPTLPKGLEKQTQLKLNCRQNKKHTLFASTKLLTMFSSVILASYIQATYVPPVISINYHFSPPHIIVFCAWAKKAVSFLFTLPALS